MQKERKAHALLSASASHRWLNCTAAPRYEEQFPDGETSVYAQEGTLAHKFCEEVADYNFHNQDKRTFNRHIEKLKKDPLYSEEMEKTAMFYGQYLWQKYLSFENKPFTVQEDRVDLTDWIPDGFGTCDSVMIGSGRLHITDYKHGKGVAVDSKNNPQMRLYALGALKKYMPIFGDTIKVVSMAIVQPRITEEVDEEELTVEELFAWGERIKPIAQRAHDGNGEFLPGTWCRFCKGRHVCRARSENATAMEDFKDALIEGNMTEDQKKAVEAQKILDGNAPVMLSDEEVADLIKRGEILVAWYEDLKDYALQAILTGKTIPGFKVVAGKSNRAFKDEDAAFKAIMAGGYEEAMLYERKAKSLSALEKMIGKKDFESLVGKYVIKPMGKPTLVDAADKRPDYNEAAKDFEGITDTGDDTKRT